MNGKRIKRRASANRFIIDRDCRAARPVRHATDENHECVVPRPQRRASVELVGLRYRILFL
jgi:hypothetical protein